MRCIEAGKSYYRNRLYQSLADISHARPVDALLNLLRLSLNVSNLHVIILMMADRQALQLAVVTIQKFQISEANIQRCSA